MKLNGESLLVIRTGLYKPMPSVRTVASRNENGVDGTWRRFGRVLLPVDGLLYLEHGDRLLQWD